MVKTNLISISIVIGCFILGGFFYDMHTNNEVLRVKDMQKSQLLLNTSNLELHLLLKQSLDEGDLQDVSDTLDLLITGMSKQIKEDMTEFKLSVKQQERINNAINGKLIPCENEI